MTTSEVLIEVIPMMQFTPDMPEVLPVIERAKREVLDDIASGIVPPTVASFSELHDYVDANEYGGACEDDSPGPPHGDGMMDDVWAFWNCVQDAVDAWLKEGRPCAS